MSKSGGKPSKSDDESRDTSGEITTSKSFFLFNILFDCAELESLFIAQMNPRVLLCMLHEGCDWVLPLSSGRPTLDAIQRFQSSPDTVISPQESKWRDLYHFLFNRGLELRPRYRPGWVPSWLGTDLSPWACEDGICAIVCFSFFQSDIPVFLANVIQFPLLLDAKDLSANRMVCIKMISEKTDELQIGRYLTPIDGDSPRDPTNHCVPMLDAFLDPAIDGVSYIVMPLLRPFDNPEFGAIGEVIDFVTQMLEVRKYLPCVFLI